MQRLMERSNSIARGKRALDSASAEADGQPDRKRPAIASVIVEALKVDSLQKLCSSLEPVLRRVVGEEVERALVRLGSGKLAVDGVSPKQIGPAHDGRNLQLQFRTQLSLPLFTGGKVEGEQGSAIHVVLVDANTGHVVTSGPESCVKLDIVVLEGDFNPEDDENWSQQDFEKHVVKERDGKRPLLTGDVQFTLKGGVGALGELAFTDNSSWIRSRKFRLGVKVVQGNCHGFRIREGKTEAFTVKDHRGELYKKHYPPALTDEVWRLEKIGKDGSFHKRLNKAGILTVEHFLRFVVRDPQRLRDILGTGMPNKMWDTVIEHAKTCVLGGKFYIYYPDDGQGVGVVFNDIYEFSGLVAGGQYLTSESLSENQKVYADNLAKKAYDNWMHVLEYDSKSLLSLKPDNKNQSAPQTEATCQQNVSSSHQQHTPPTLHAAVPPYQSFMDSNLKVGGISQNISPPVNLSGTIQYDALSLPQSQLNSRGNQEMPIATPDSSLAGLQPLTSFKGISDFLLEEDTCLGGHEMLGHEDMQHLLRMFDMGGHGGEASANISNGNPHPSAFASSSSVNYGFEEDMVQTSGKGVLGWLKLKAALRWGIFVRKRAAEKRAQLVELDET